MRDDFDDHAEYARFTGKQRLDKAMHTLHGLVQGIVADDKVDDSEVASLIRWASNHREFANRHPLNEVIPRINDIVADGVVDEEERADLLWMCNKFTTDDVYFDAVTSDMQRLQGFLSGILADGRITEDELASLTAWIDAHEHLRACWPYDELDSLITHVMQDGKVDDQEHEALMQFFGEFANTTERKAVGALDREATISGVCAMCPEIQFDGQLFCLTGTSDRGPRQFVVETIEKAGGKFNKGLRKDTRYLIVGSSGNPCWAYACYGRKVEEAVERRRHGQQLLIVHEFDFWDAVADLN